MKIQELGIHEMARAGFTHKAVISVAQGDFSLNGLSQAIVLAALAVGHVINNAAVRVVTPVSGGTIASASFTLGDVATPAGFITATDVFTGTVALAKAGDGTYLAASGGKAYAAAAQLQVGITTTVGNVNAATAGEIHVYFSLLKLGDI